MAQPTPDNIRKKKPASTSQKKPAGPSPDAEENATEAVMGLDMVLVDAARGPLRRLVPPAGTALRFGSSLARRSGRVSGMTASDSSRNNSPVTTRTDSVSVPAANTTSS